MKKLLVTLACLIGASQSLYAEEVLYCQSELATGFIKEGGVWKSSNFQLARFTLRFNDDFTKLSGLPSPGEYFCDTPLFSTQPDFVVCNQSIGSYGSNKRRMLGKTFSYRKQTKRFIFAHISSAGWIEDSEDADTDVLLVGTCQNF